MTNKRNTLDVLYFSLVNYASYFFFVDAVIKGIRLHPSLDRDDPDKYPF